MLNSCYHRGRMTQVLLSTQTPCCLTAVNTEPMFFNSYHHRGLTAWQLLTCEPYPYRSAPVNTGRIVQQLLPQRPYIAQLLLTHGLYCSAAVISLLLSTC